MPQSSMLVVHGAGPNAPPAHRVWLMASCLAPVSGSAATPHSQNLMSWSALPLTKPLASGRAASDHTGPEWALQQGAGAGGGESAAGKEEACSACTALRGALQDAASIPTCVMPARRSCNALCWGPRCRLPFLVFPSPPTVPLHTGLQPAHSLNHRHPRGGAHIKNLDRALLCANNGVAVAGREERAQAVPAVHGTQAGPRPRVPHLGVGVGVGGEGQMRAKERSKRGEGFSGHKFTEVGPLFR